jgi:hypothetical protein
MQHAHVARRRSSCPNVVDMCVAQPDNPRRRRQTVGHATRSNSCFVRHIRCTGRSGPENTHAYNR